MSSVPSRFARSRADLLVAIGGSLAGLAILLVAQGFPPGIGRLPGPGFFPSVLGVLMILFAIASVFDRANSAESSAPQPVGAWRQPLLTVLVLTVYLIAWESVPFLLRTPLVVFALMKLFGARLAPAVAAALLLPALLFAIFQLGLRVDLN